MSFLIYAFYVEQKGHFYTNRPFYIGKTSVKRFNLRLYSHQYQVLVAHDKSRSPSVYSHIRFVHKKACKLEKQGFTWKARILKVFDTEEQVNACEQLLINRMGRIVDQSGWLYNITGGGDNGEMPISTRKKISVSLYKRNELFWSVERIADIKAKYLSGISAIALGRELGVHVATVQRYLRLAGVLIRNKKDADQFFGQNLDRSKWGWTPESMEQMKTLYAEGKSTKDIARIFKVDPTTVSKRLKSMGVTIRKRAVNHHDLILRRMPLSVELATEIMRLYNEEKLSINDIVTKLDLPINADSLTRRLKLKFGFKQRSREEVNDLQRVKFTDEQKEEIKKLYSECGQYHLIAKKFATSDSVIKKLLSELGVITNIS